MRKLITTIMLLALVDTSVAIVHAADSGNRAAPPATNPGQQVLPLPAPVGHRQPRADQVPAEEKLTDPNDPINQQNAALDRMINGICRGC
jgi:Spy/CpxP family protein refolding chaperone